MLNRDNSYLKGNTFAKGNPGNKTSFEKGVVPWNKGMEGLRVSKKSEFKKGSTPSNKLPKGSITQRIDKSGAKRNWIKIEEPNIWEPYAIYVYKQAGHDIEEGFCIHHINSDPLDDRIENLEQLSRADHVKLHNQWKAGI